MKKPTDSGIDLIIDERQRQIDVEGWSLSHDDEHDDGELTAAAICYIKAAGPPEGRWSKPRWPWQREAWKPSADPVPNLVKAGALIAAEIDRLQRKESRRRRHR